MRQRIRAVALDIDGVLTDGHLVLDEHGRETKLVFLRDLDAVAQARAEGLRLALVTGEESPMAEMIANRLGIETLVRGAKDKEAALRGLCERLGVLPGEVCYVGDSDRDGPALALVGLGTAPADASVRARDRARVVLRAPGGRGAVAEALELVRRLNESLDGAQPGASAPADMRRRVEMALEESIAVKRAVVETITEEVATAAAWVAETIRGGGKILLVGNGGSAADAQHIAAELVGRFEGERRPLPAIALTTDTSVLTALGNDYGVETMFARQVEALGRPADLLVAISTSGWSPNVLAAVEAARHRGMRTIALTGAAGDALAAAADLALRVPSTRPARIQESHIAIGHAICEVVEAAQASESGE